MHRQILNVPEGLEIDHKNHNMLDNRKYNIRTCSKAENQHNRKTQKHSSKYKGVSWHKERRKWRTRICNNGKEFSLGLFDSEIEAAKAYDQKAKELFGEFAYLNFEEKEASNSFARMRGAKE